MVSFRLKDSESGGIQFSGTLPPHSTNAPPQLCACLHCMKYLINEQIEIVYTDHQFVEAGQDLR